MEHKRAAGLFWEGLVVVASILTAFALDAWWDARMEGASLRLELEVVAQELSDNRSALEQRLQGHKYQISSIDRIVELHSANSGSGSIEVFDSLLFRASVTSPTTDPSAGAIEALIASGRISLVQDVELRRFLAGFRSRVEDVREDELGARVVGHDKVFPVLSGQAAAEAAALVGLQLGLTSDTPLPVSRSTLTLDPEGWNSLRANLALRRFWLWSAVVEGEAFLEAMDVASERLGREIADL